MYKVFFNERFILLTDRQDEELMVNGLLYFEYDDFEELHFVLDLLEQSPAISGIVVHSETLSELWADFRAHFREIEAGGGIVHNSVGEILLIFRNGLWDLPKGKAEPGESLQNTALREVMEECGASRLEVQNHICCTYHIYHVNGNRILKHTAWYHMKSDQKKFTPQLEENIEEVKWVQLNSLNWQSYPTYPNIELAVAEFTIAIGLS